MLKARTGAHEVITTIMLNYVAYYLLAYLLSVKGFQRPPYGQAISNVVEGNARLPHLLGGNLRLHTGLLVALLAAYGVHWLLTRSTLGFQLRAVGANQFAARTAGMSVERSYVVVMLISGVAFTRVSESGPRMPDSVPCDAVPGSKIAPSNSAT